MSSMPTRLLGCKQKPKSNKPTLSDERLRRRIRNASVIELRKIDAPSDSKEAREKDYTSEDEHCQTHYGLELASAVGDLVEATHDGASYHCV